MNEALLDDWRSDIDTSQVKLEGTPGRIVAWHCLAPDERYIEEVRNHFRGSDGFARMFKSAALTGVVYHCLEQHPELPPGVYPIRIPQASSAFEMFERSYRVVGCFAKITTPLLFPDAKAFLNLDADLSVHCRRAEHDRETGEEIETLFDMASRFGFIVTRHPAATWTGEPMSPDQKEAYMTRPGMHRLIPLYVCGVLARHAADDRQRKLTAAWIEEFLDRPTREQPTLSAAVWRSGITPLAAPMTLCSLGADRIRFGLECLFVHRGKY